MELLLENCWNTPRTQLEYCWDNAGTPWSTAETLLEHARNTAGTLAERC